ncbi:MAG: hypothetical protein GY938_21775 [Ketobacter sp.]|nr:hypothetical protein [Ketobacter sp.]
MPATTTSQASERQLTAIPEDIPRLPTYPSKHPGRAAIAAALPLRLNHYAESKEWNIIRTTSQTG